MTQLQYLQSGGAPRGAPGGQPGDPAQYVNGAARDGGVPAQPEGDRHSPPAADAADLPGGPPQLVSPRAEFAALTFTSASGLPMLMCRGAIQLLNQNVSILNQNFN